MKRLIIGLAVSLATLIGLGATAGATASYCGPGAYNTKYRAVYQYPTGTYWQNQINKYPDYYAANNDYYLTTYGC